MEFKALAQKGKIGKLEIKNRIVIPPVNTNYAHNAYMTDESLDYYTARAKGGAGLMIVEHTSIDYPRSRSVLNPALDDDKYIPGYKRIADSCHEYGAKVMAQINHVGRQTKKSITGMDPVAPSAIASSSPQYPDTPKSLEIGEIKEIIEKFGRAAARLKAAGLDGVEIILAHGYLMNNFVSPLSNLRTDEYGGIKGGIKFCVDVIKTIKTMCGDDFPVVCRVNGDDFVREKGNTIIEAQMICQQLEKAGADAINVSGGMRESDLNFNDHTSGTLRGAWIHLAHRIKRVVGIPVMVVKRFSPELAEETVKSGKADFICFGKQSIADSGFAGKILSGRTEDIIPCTSCCQGCYDLLWMHKPITCMVNPRVGRTVTYLKSRDVARGNKTVLVAGGGPAGCEAALELAHKGHKVTLAEKTEALGGDYGYCRYTGAKKEVADVFKYLDKAMRNAGVDIRLKTPFSPALLDELKPQAVVDATGASFKLPDIEGVDLPVVVNLKEAVAGTRELGDYVVIVSCGYECNWTCGVKYDPIPDDIIGMKAAVSYACSAGHAAADAAEELARRGKKVAIITERDKFVPGMGFTNRGNLFKRLFVSNINISNNAKVKKVIADGLLCEKEGIEFKVCADSVIFSAGMKPNDEIKQQIAGYTCEFYQVGDCQITGNAMKAFHSGYEVVDKI